ncbi:MAG: hypothetical protein EA397_00880 [Deltaproteobacteria bacterium]|nr:MAG: hypothetical protein EA397_00880 [Deltaproteobacteria bacterium]
MPALMTSLRNRLDAADAMHEQSRFGAALAAYEDLVERAQERSDRSIEVQARSMAARCLLSRGDLDGARAHLDAAAPMIFTAGAVGERRYRAARARLACHDPGAASVESVLHDYLRWADSQGDATAIIDACTLFSERTEGEQRVMWLQRAVDEGRASGVVQDLGRLLTELGACLDGLDRLDEALAAYESAIEHQDAGGPLRKRVGSRWAAGEAALRLEDYPLARAHLESGVQLAENTDDALDLLTLALSDLARVYEAAGDVVEARRVTLRAVDLAREQDLAGLWPARWRSLMEFGRSLDLDL